MKEDLVSKRILVVGLGKSGLAALRLLQRVGCRSLSAMELKENDSSRALAAELGAEGVAVSLGPHQRSFLEGNGLVVTSPGVPWDRPPLSWAREEGIPVLGEIELASRYCRGRILAVTGTNGKSTTVSLIHHILCAAGKPSVLCGNIGEPFAGKVLEVQPGDSVVLEVSSFQLLGSVSFRPDLAILLNVTPNHLDWHPDFESYLQAKRRIFQNQGPSDLLGLNVQDPTLRRLSVPANGPRRLWFGLASGRLNKGDQATSAAETVRRPGRGVFAEGGWMVSTLGEKEERLFRLSELTLPGPHNVANASAAVLASLSVGVPLEAIREGVRTFRGLEHRLEQVAQFRGVTFVNDSKATTVESARQALLAISDPILLIAGGRDKRGDFTVLRELLSQRVRKLFLIGEARPKMREAFQGCLEIDEAATLEEALWRAYREAKKGQTVLLSPMCASFDMFENFEARGRAFKEAVRRLIEKETRCVTNGSPSFSSS